jgi:hypothetical protein
MGYESVPMINLMEKHDNYIKEARAIKAKISNGVPLGKEERLKYRLNDIETRLKPGIIKKTY